MKIFFLILLSIIVLTIIIVLSFFFWLRRGIVSLSKEYNSCEKTSGKSDKKVLILYQPSIHNTAKNITNTIVDTFLNLNYSTTTNYISENLTYDINEYDIIAFGSPVYVGKISPKFENYINKIDIKDKKILLYSIGSIETETTEFDHIESILDSQNTVFKIKITPKSIYQEKLESFIKNITE